MLPTTHDIYHVKKIIFQEKNIKLRRHNAAKTEEEEKTSTFFHSGGPETNFNAIFWMLTLGHICCSFSFVLVSISLIQGWRVKGMLSIKILVLCPPELEFCGLRKAKKNPKI